VDGPIPEGKLKVFKEKNAGNAPRAAPAAEAGAVPGGDGVAARAPTGGGEGAGGASTVNAASEPSSGGERGGRGGRATTREIAAAAAEERARREDPEERRMRLGIAEHNKRQELLGRVAGAYRLRQEAVPVNIGRLTDEELRQTLRRLRPERDDVVSEPTIVALSEEAL
jgi:hypothetical protein